MIEDEKNSLLQAIYKSSVFLISFIFLIWIHISSAYAAPASVPDLTVSPYLIADLNADPGTSQDKKFQLRNNTNGDLFVIVNFENFGAPTDKTGNPTYFLSKGNTDATFYPQSWFIAPKSLKISANTEIDILVHVNVPQNASPGGHYGGAFFYPSHTDLPANENINVAGKIAVPVLIKVSGNILDRLSLSHFSVTPSFISFFSSFNNAMLCIAMPDCTANIEYEFHNTGNIHEIPVGTLEVFDPFGTKVFTTHFNYKEKTAILPYSSRIYNSFISLKDIAGLKEGLYTTKIALVYSDQHFTLQGTSHVWILDLTPLGILLIIGIGGFILYIKKLSKRAKFRSKIG